MDFADCVRLLRKHRILICLALCLGVIGGGLVTFWTTPLYASSVTFFVTTPDRGGDLAQAYQGGLLSQQRIKSYQNLMTSDRLANAVAKRVGFPTDPRTISREITAQAQPDTMLLTATATDASPSRAQRISSVLSEEFPRLVTDLETPSNAKAPTINVEVVEGPKLAPGPVAPKPWRNIGLAGLLGLIIGLGLAALRESLDTSVRSGEELSLLSGAATLGLIVLDPEAKTAPLICQSRGQSLRSESFRQLRTNLQFVSVDRACRVITVTSALPDEGKSTTAANLAFTVAEAGSRVLLIEGDLRRPRVVDYLGLEGAVGLTNVLVGQVPVGVVLQQWGSGTTLSVLPSGSIPPNPSELLASQRMSDVLHELAPRFDLVVIDAPPLLPVTDGAVLAAKSDGALVVVRSGRTTKAQVRQAVATLTAVDARVVGTVLNMVPRKGADSYGYGYYRYEEDGANRPKLVDPAEAERTRV